MKIILSMPTCAPYENRNAHCIVVFMLAPIRGERSHASLIYILCKLYSFFLLLFFSILKQTQIEHFCTHTHTCSYFILPLEQNNNKKHTLTQRTIIFSRTTCIERTNHRYSIHWIWFEWNTIHLLTVGRICLFFFHLISVCIQSCLVCVKDDEEGRDWNIDGDRIQKNIWFSLYIIWISSNFDLLRVYSSLLIRCSFFIRNNILFSKKIEPEQWLL